MSATATTPPASTPVAGRGRGLRRALQLTRHLVARDIAMSHRLSVIGAGWPLLRQLAQLAVLVFVFSSVIDLGVPDYPVFVFCGLVAWTWFMTAMSGAASAVLTYRNLAMRPAFPTIVLPLVAIAVPLTDVLFALPVLLVMLELHDGLRWQVVLLPALLALQGVLMVGLGWLAATATVFVRDIPNVVGLALMLGFYVTPVYFDVGRVPEEYQWVLRLNPVAVLLEADRAVLLGTPFPPLWSFLGVLGAAVAAVVAGLLVFRRFAPAFADEL